MIDLTYSNSVPILTRHQPLSLKYRPKNLANLVGQEPIKIALTNAVTSTKIAPAYLFTGPRGTGKTSTARILAKSLNCLNSAVTTANPCQKCASCKAIDAGNSLDVSEIDAASHNGVEDARELIERSNFAPAMSRYRIFVLDECHQLSSSAQNALLKCIEEPAGSRITKEQAIALIPITTSNSLQLAQALLKRETIAIVQIVRELLSRAEFPLVIVATLITQFKTWLWVKAALVAKRSDSEIATLCGLGNPKRMYFLRQ